MIAWAKSRRVLVSLLATIILAVMSVSVAQVLITVPNLRSAGIYAHSLGLFTALLSGSITAYQISGRSPLENTSVRATDVLDAILVLLSFLVAATATCLLEQLGIETLSNIVLRNMVASSTMALLLVPIVSVRVAAFLPPSWGVLAGLVGIGPNGIDFWALPISQAPVSFVTVALLTVVAAVMYVVLTRSRPRLTAWTAWLRWL